MITSGSFSRLIQPELRALWLDWNSKMPSPVLPVFPSRALKWRLWMMTTPPVTSNKNSKLLCRRWCVEVSSYSMMSVARLGWIPWCEGTVDQLLNSRNFMQQAALVSSQRKASRLLALRDLLSKIELRIPLWLK